MSSRMFLKIGYPSLFIELASEKAVHFSMNRELLFSIQFLFIGQT